MIACLLLTAVLGRRVEWVWTVWRRSRDNKAVQQFLPAALRQPDVPDEGRHEVRTGNMITASIGIGSMVDSSQMEDNLEKCGVLVWGRLRVQFPENFVSCVRFII